MTSTVLLGEHSLFGVRHRPAALTCLTRNHHSECDKPKQEFSSAFSRKRVSFEIEKDVAGRRWRKACKSKASFDRKQFMHGHPSYAPFELDPCLLSDARKSLDCPSPRNEAERNRQLT